MSYKIKKCRAIPKDEWIVVEGTHEPIIDRETFDNAQALFNKHITLACFNDLNEEKCIQQLNNFTQTHKAMPAYIGSIGMFMRYQNRS